MAESMFNGKVTLTAGASLITVKVDIIKHETYVEIRLIDTSNIFTLFVCSITQSDFYIMKRDQDILVDYERFVHILVNLFHSLSTSRLSATFNDGVLRFIENSEFRNICKLEIRFLKPEEGQYKRYLADLLARMENDNIKLIKENSILRDKCLNGDRELREKVRYLESEGLECKRRMDLQSKDFGLLEAKYSSREEEMARMSSRIFSLENENSQLKYELEKYQKDNSQSYRELLKAKEDELEASLKEVNVANEIIRKIRQENSDLKEHKLEKLNKVQKEVDKNEELSEKLAAMSKKYKSLEEKYKVLKDDNKNKTARVQELEASNKGLAKNLENAQNVYNHFRSKKVEDQEDNYSDTFSLRPESPPPR